MVDINTLFTTALTKAIEEAISPLRVRIESLETEITTLRNIPPTATPSTTPMLEAKEGEMPITWENIRNTLQEIADDAARMVLSEHNEEYDHDKYDRLEDEIDDKITDAIDEYDFEDKIKDALNGASITINI